MKSYNSKMGITKLIKHSEILSKDSMTISHMIRKELQDRELRLQIEFLSQKISKTKHKLFKKNHL